MTEELSSFSPEIKKSKKSIIKTVPQATTVKLEKYKFTARLEEKFFSFCTNVLESSEREGKLPLNYTEIPLDRVIALKNSNYDGEIDRPNQVIEDHQSPNKEEEELPKVKEVMSLNKRSSERVVNIQGEESLHNPLGNDIGDVTLLITADKHHAPSDVHKGVRAQAFKAYAVERVVEKLSGKKTQPDFRDEKGKRYKSPDYVEMKFATREAALQEFDDWVERVVKHEQYEEEHDNTMPLLASVGDLVQDGAELDAQIDERSQVREMMLRVSKHASLIEIYGNHDQDSRIPESFSYLSEIFGHGVFTQEVAQGVLIVGVDTNILSPSWLKIFYEKADNREKEYLKERLSLQRKVVEKMRKHKGPVVLMGHHPSRIVDAYSIKDDVLQNSNVQTIITGHTHDEAHVILPFKNKSGQSITMHTCESYVHTKDGKPQAPKLYGLKIKNGEILPMTTMQQPQERFLKNVEARIY